MIIPEPEFHANILSKCAKRCTDNKYEYIPLPMPENHRRNHEHGVDYCNGFHNNKDRYEIIKQYPTTEYPKNDFLG